MKRILSIIAVAGLLVTAPAAFARVSVHIDLVGPAPVYVPPPVRYARVYVAPSVPYYPVYSEPTVYYEPVYVAPQPRYWHEPRWRGGHGYHEPRWRGGHGDRHEHRPYRGYRYY